MTWLRECAAYLDTYLKECLMAQGVAQKPQRCRLGAGEGRGALAAGWAATALPECGVSGLAFARGLNSRAIYLL